MPFPILFGTTVTTVLHYRADCDVHILSQAQVGVNVVGMVVQWLSIGLVVMKKS